MLVIFQYSKAVPLSFSDLIQKFSSMLFVKGKWSGLKTKNLDYYYQLLLNKSEFKIRSQLENDPNYKQIIPQIILKYKDKYFLHKQINANEKRLNGLCPLPLGGHVEKFDLNNDQDVIQTALYRELDEEAQVNANIIKKILQARHQGIQLKQGGKMTAAGGQLNAGEDKEVILFGQPPNTIDGFNRIMVGNGHYLKASRRGRVHDLLRGNRWFAVAH